MTSSPVNRRQWQPSPYVILAVGVLAVSTASIFIRFAQNSQTPSLVIAAMRLSLASLILTPFALRNHRPALRALPRGGLGLALLSGAFLAVHFASWITSLEHVSVLVSVVLVTSNPLWVALLAPLLLRERLSRRTLISILIAFTGGVLISLAEGGSATRPGGSPLLGSALAITGAISAALYLIIGRRLRASLDLVPYIWLVYGTAAVVLLLTVAATGHTLLGYSPEAYLWMLLLAIVPQLIGHSSFNYALRHLPAAFVSLVTLGEPVGSTILAIAILQETPTLLQFVGAALILFAVATTRQVEEKTLDEVAPVEAGPLGR